jgi:hypothetical protein
MKKLICDKCGTSRDRDSTVNVNTYSISKKFLNIQNTYWFGTLTSGGVDVPIETELCFRCHHELDDLYKKFILEQLKIDIRGK